MAAQDDEASCLWSRRAGRASAGSAEPSWNAPGRPEESERLRDLLSLHNTIRDAPATFTTTHTAVRTATGLIVPTGMLLITVFGEVSAERFLETLLP